MRILHTSDWHLGQSLQHFGRDFEHESFLAWLEGTIVETEADALVVAGDIFDTSNPPASAQRLLFEFLARLYRRAPDCQVVMVGGNHDSATRLDAPSPILSSLGVRVVGGLPRDPAGRIDEHRVVTELRSRDGRRAWCAAVPYLRPADLASHGGSAESPAETARLIYEEVFEIVRRKRRPDEPIIATGHLYVAGSQPSALSERKIYLGNLYAAPVGIFPPDAAYVALGHLHLPQQVASLAHVRYSGSAMPISITEAGYEHEVSLVELDAAGMQRRTRIPVPRFVDVVRLPARGAETIEVVEEMIDALPSLDPATRDAARPWLHIEIRLDQPVANLRRRVEKRLEGKAVRLVRIFTELAGSGASLADRFQGANLEELDAEEVFRQLYQKNHQGDPPAELMEAYRSLVSEVEEGGGTP